MSLSDLATVKVLTSAPLITRVGFGTPLIIGPCAAFGASPDRVRTYTSLAGMETDGFVAADPEHRAAAALLEQENPPTSFKVARRLNLPTMQWLLTPTAANLTKYIVTIDGQDAVFTSDANATLAEICAGMKAAIDALALAVTVTNVGPNTAVQIVANAAGAFHSIKCCTAADTNSPNPYIDVKQNHADPGVAADLDAILAADPNWYAGHLCSNGAAEILAAAAWFESHGAHLFFPLTQDSACYASGATGTNSIRGQLAAAGYFRTAISYHHDPVQFENAAWLGFGLPTDPGTENWSGMPLEGITATTLTETQKANLDAGFCNYFYGPVAPNKVTRKGVVSGNEWIDRVRYRDAFSIGLQEDIAQATLDASAQGKKIAYDDGGIAVYESIIRAAVQAGQDIGAVETTPAPVYTVPLASTISAADRKNRVLNGLEADFQLTGAINLVNITVSMA